MNGAARPLAHGSPTRSNVGALPEGWMRRLRRRGAAVFGLPAALCGAGTTPRTAPAGHARGVIVARSPAARPGTVILVGLSHRFRSTHTGRVCGRAVLMGPRCC